MKNNRLLIFGGMMLLGHLSAQTILPEKSVHSAEPQLLRTETYQAYGVKSPTDSTAFARTTYDYPTVNERTETNFQFDGEVWLPQSRLSYTFDALKRSIALKIERYNASTKQFVPQSRQQAYPHGSTQQKDSLLSYNWSIAENKYVPTSRQVSIFNAKDQVMEIATTITISGQVIRSKNLYFYDVNNNLAKTENYNFLGDVASLSSFTRYTFANKLLLNTTSYTAIGMDSLPQSRQVYRYNGLNLLEQLENFRWDSTTKTWTKANIAIYGYDADKRFVLQEITITNTGQPDQKNRSEYFYNKDGSTKCEANYTFNTSTQAYKLDNKKFYFYDVASSLRAIPTKHLALEMFPNPTDGLLQLKLNNRAKIQVFNALGQQVHTGILPAGQALDLSNLPTGVYQILAKQAEGFYSGKILKQ